MKNNRYTNKRILSTENFIEYLFFNIEADKFAIGVSSIKQVLEYNDEIIFNVPSKQNYLIGKYNFRGQSTDLYNLKAILHYPNYDKESAIIVVLELNQNLLAFTVDKLMKIVRATNDEIKNNETKDTHPIISQTLMQDGIIIPILNTESLVTYVTT